MKGDGVVKQTRAQHMMNRSILSLGKCLVGVREATMQFVGPEKGLSNRKRGIAFALLEISTALIVFL